MVRQDLLLQIDYREKSSGMMEKLQKYSSLFRIETVRLKAGDYLIDDRILVERKTWNDFMTAVKSGRMFRQAYGMMGTRRTRLLILEGSLEVATAISLRRSNIQGLLLHIALFTGTPAMLSAGKEDTAKLIFFAGKQLLEKERPAPALVTRVRKNSGVFPKHSEALALLAGIHGLGIHRARSLLTQYGCLRQIFNANEKDLRKVKGIGPSLAARIHETALQAL